ncbi:hypothetical protein G3I32_06245 [Streptomyces coelicoflavus]|uniref:Uncharacterized protein n=1 Tax=Streptomyces coelicoflavus TaxID=285562 RepID=A0A7K3PHX0_9ACTN|nr:hypothetical protein [Streptomyces coelicoflavus]NEB08475.1 hypothetical protein [Streptomyces coelicoflavus]
MEQLPDLLAPAHYRRGLQTVDAAKRRIDALERSVNRATPPEKIWTEEQQLLGVDPWHDDLAPEIAAKRWQRVTELSEGCDELTSRWYDLEAEVTAAHNAAAKAHADALRKGTKAPTTAAKAYEAEKALEGCSIVLAEAVTELRKARKAYDTLLNDRAFVLAYRDAVVAEFKAQRAEAAKRFHALSSAVMQTRRRYVRLMELTVDGTDAIHDDQIPYLPLGKGWANPALVDSLSTLEVQVKETDPVLSGDLLTMPLAELSEVATELAEDRKAEVEANRQNYFSPDGIFSSQMITANTA